MLGGHDFERGCAGCRGVVEELEWLQWENESWVEVLVMQDS